jgi:hypothetical protein
MDKRMTQWFKISVVAVILMNSFVLNAQQVFHSIDEIWTYAKENNPDNSVYQLQVEKAVKTKKQPIALYILQLMLDFQVSTILILQKPRYPVKLWGDQVKQNT